MIFLRKMIFPVVIFALNVIARRFPRARSGEAEPGEDGLRPAPRRLGRRPVAAAAVKCALRWRGSVRLSARLRAQTPEDQLCTVRYEDLVNRPARVIESVADYLGTPLSKAALAGIDDRGVGVWRDRLTHRQVTQVERIAGTELRRLGYQPAIRLITSFAG